MNLVAHLLGIAERSREAGAVVLYRELTALSAPCRRLRRFRKPWELGPHASGRARRAVARYVGRACEPASGIRLRTQFATNHSARIRLGVRLAASGSRSDGAHLQRSTVRTPAPGRYPGACVRARDTDAVASRRRSTPGAGMAPAHDAEQLRQVGPVCHQRHLAVVVGRLISTATIRDVPVWSTRSQGNPTSIRYRMAHDDHGRPGSPMCRCSTEGLYFSRDVEWTCVPERQRRTSCTMAIVFKAATFPAG